MSNTENTVNLVQLLAANDDLITNVEYKSGIMLKLRYIPKTVLTQISRESTTWKYDEKQNQRSPQIDSKKLIKALCAKAVLGWENVTPKALSQIVRIDLKKLTPEQIEAPVPFSQEQCVAVVEQAYGLDVFIQESATNIAIFSQDEEQHEEELKNSNASETGN